MKHRNSNKKGDRPGPVPEILKIKDDWRSAMKKALDKKSPKKRWPKQKSAKKKRR